MSASAKAIIAEIRWLGQEVRAAGLGLQPPPWKPIPCCLDAEQDICALLLGGYKVPSELAPLQPQHFFASLFRNIFEAAAAVEARAEVVALDTIAAELERRGMFGPVHDELVQTRDCTPMVSQLQLRRRISEMMELALRRRLIDLLHRTELAVRTGELDCDAARAQLTGFFEEVLG